MQRQIALLTLLIGFANGSLAAVPAEQAQELGKSLTLFGAIQAGNAEGSIPPYEGGLREIPAGFKPDSGFWVDPFRMRNRCFASLRRMPGSTRTS